MKKVIKKFVIGFICDIRFNVLEIYLIYEKTINYRIIIQYLRTILKTMILFMILVKFKY